MKSGLTKILFLGTIGLGIYCCGQVFLSEDHAVTVSAPVDWQFVNASLKGDQSTQSGIAGYPDSEPSPLQVALDTPFQPPGQQTSKDFGHRTADSGSVESEIAKGSLQRVTALPNVEPLMPDEITGETVSNPFFESDSPNNGQQDRPQLAELYREAGTSALPDVSAELEIKNPYYPGNSGQNADSGSRLADANLPNANSTELEITNPYYSAESTGTDLQLAGTDSVDSSSAPETVTRAAITNPYFVAGSVVAEAAPATPQVATTNTDSDGASRSMPEAKPARDNETEQLANAPMVPVLEQPGEFRVTPNNARAVPKMAQAPSPASTLAELSAPPSTMLRAPQPITDQRLAHAADPESLPGPESTATRSNWVGVETTPPVTATTVRTASVVRTVAAEVDPLPLMTTSAVVEQRAREHIQYGQSLARRGAVFAARQEFIQALRLIADSHDMNGGSRDYTQKLATALRVLGESDDFIAADSEQQLEMNLESILETHTAKLIPTNQAHRVTPIKAMQIYYDFATREMAQSVGKSVVASEALHSLGKLLTTSAQSDANGKPLDNAKAMVMHQVALAADPNNYKSANELGVLMARNGRWKQAHDLFTQSLRSHKTPETWRNLAGIHQQLARVAADPQTRADQHDLASLARREYEMMMRDGVYTQPGGPMQWVSPEDFDERAAMPEVQAQPSSRTAQTPARVEAPPKRRGLFGKAKDWF